MSIKMGVSFVFLDVILPRRGTWERKPQMYRENWGLDTISVVDTDENQCYTVSTEKLSSL